MSKAWTAGNGDRARNFPIERINRDGITINAAKIECCDCGSAAYSTSRAGLSPKVHEQYFRNRGWTVGNGPRRDKCPSCMNKGKPKLSVVKMEKPKPEKPREMTRDERLIIMDKIRDVHDGDRYGSGWSDKKVAEDLGVPTAWVSDIRENVLMFQGAHDEVFDAFMEMAAPVIADMKNMANSIRVQLETTKAIETKLSGAMAKIDELEKMMQKVNKTIGK